ncbi:hypothetical protein [Absidia glauca]|uniref:Uncharacterized protein n=1 Tax=Absidia glauca TaxID=4829 RepID=A0A168PRE5_ABSGL|nr:hypothetical protein [Absidia glauca]
MQRYDPRLGGDRKHPTTALAHFLATTGPEVPQAVSFADYHPQRATNKKNLFDRLRKKTSHANTKSAVQQQQQQQEAGFQMYPSDGPMVHRKYIPLADDINQPHRYPHSKAHQQQPTFYDTEDTSYTNVGETLPTFPTPPASSLHESLEAHLPHSSSTSTTISDRPTKATPTTTTKNPIRGLRHIQVQTDAVVPTQPANDGRCSRCCRPLNHPRNRRDSSPAILPSGTKIKLGQEATMLLALIDQLKQQLAEEQQSRKILEKAIQLQWDTNKKE